MLLSFKCDAPRPVEEVSEVKEDVKKEGSTEDSSSNDEEEEGEGSASDLSKEDQKEMISMVMAEVGCTKETATQAFEDAEWHIPTALNILVNSGN